jgi:hypothetical protein
MDVFSKLDLIGNPQSMSGSYNFDDRRQPAVALRGPVADLFFDMC